MRIIKFRQWTGDRFSYWGFSKPDASDFVSPIDQEFESQQYTELKDKNGIEIYEGDICSFDDQIPREVFWIGGGFHTNTTRISPYWASELEVIGNIYEDPELLEDEL